MTLKNKRAIVTGAASGIGRAVALCFAKQGAWVGVADIQLDQALEVVKIIQAQGGQAQALFMDVASETSVNQAIRDFGMVDILVSNAGIQHIEAVDQLSFANWRKMLAIHLDGAFLTTKACLPMMYQQNSGSIIYIGSVHSKEASRFKAPYVTAKHGLLGLCRVVAKEGAAHHVRANVVCPGFVLTPLVEAQIPAQARELGISEEEVVKKVMLGQTVDGEFTNLDDIAEACLFFASAKSQAMTGQSLIVSHGWFME